MANRTKLLDLSELTQSKFRNNLTGREFDKLTVESYAGHRGKNAYWWCVCRCGTRKIVRGSCLIGGSNKTCGSCPKARNSKHHAWKGCGEISQNLWGTYENSAKPRGLEFSVTIEHAWELFLKQERRCAFTGWPLYFNQTFKGQSDRTASLDRIDSTKGYVAGNIQWVHRDVNKLKKNLPDDYFVRICLAVADRAETTVD